MGTKDISRSMFDPRKHYTAKWLQQGRLISDFDENDGEAIAGEERRRTRLDVIGPYGTPDSGFLVDNVRRAGNEIDFDLLAGTLYLGGLRLELEEMQSFRLQSDLLQITSNVAPTANSQRRDLVLIEAFEAPVTAVEDGELLDPALGGADTAARGRRFQRVVIFPDIATPDCSQAWSVFQERAAQSGIEISADYQVLSDSLLAVTYTEEGVDDDLCEPPLAGGYLGAENQAIRVQRVGTNLVTWGFDNASKLHRVTLSADRTKITLITPPRDEYSTPFVGQVIEILPWGSLLPNGEKTAGLLGHLTRITAVDPSDENAGGAMTVTLQNGVPVTGFEEWRDRADAALLEADGVYYFMRVWNRGSDITSAPELPYVDGTPLTLGTTGIQVTITGTDDIRGDYWIIAARPETPTRVLPWTLENGAPPNGVRRFVAPLAVIHWQANGEIEVTDCRPPFRPLTDADCCCTFTVGDGMVSDGHFNDLNEALARLGSSGGEICLLPGLHLATVELVGRANITISGCGERSKLLPLNPDDDAVITLRECSDIGLFNFEIVSADGAGIVAEGVDGLRIEDIFLLAYQSAIDVRDAQHVAIRRCVIRMLDREDGDVGIFAQGEGIMIEGCDIQVIPAGEPPTPPDDNDPDTPPVDPTDPCADPEKFYRNRTYLVYYVAYAKDVYTLYQKAKQPYLALGGIQIGSGSEQVTIRDNLIVGGAGNGITLGSDIGEIDIEGTDNGDNDGDNDDDGEDDFEDLRISHHADIIIGQVLLDEKPIGGMSIFFENTQGKLFAFALSDEGEFRGELPPGEYVVFVSNTEYGVLKFEQIDDVTYRFHLARRSAGDGTGRSDLDKLLDFIESVLIEANTIANMGFAGIGSPRFDSSDAIFLNRGVEARRDASVTFKMIQIVYELTGSVTGFVVDLTIYRNTITRCLQNAPDPRADRFILERALGGIRLALCDGLTIVENAIEDCGIGAEQAVCGIFVSFAIDVTLRENHVLNNGQDTRAKQVADSFARPRPAGDLGNAGSIGSASGAPNRRFSSANPENYTRYRWSAAAATFASARDAPDLQPGIRGGIILSFVLSATAFAGGDGSKATLPSLRAQGVTTAAEGRHAARIDGNYVVQPLGKALLVVALGSLSITNNQLISDFALPRQLEAQASGSNIVDIAQLPLVGYDFFAATVQVVNLMPTPHLLALMAQVSGATTLARRIPIGCPDGNILFTSNQIRQGDMGDRVSAVSIFSIDDVNFVDNQVDILNGAEIMSTVLLFGWTSRAANNRFKEPFIFNLDITRYSLVNITIAFGTMIGNQGHYCFRLYSSDSSAMLGNHTLLASCEPEATRGAPTDDDAFMALLTVVAAFVRSIIGNS